MGSDESHLNVSLIVRDKVTRQCPQTTIFEEKGEPKGTGTEVPLLTSLPLGQTGSPVCDRTRRDYVEQMDGKRGKWEQHTGSPTWARTGRRLSVAGCCTWTSESCSRQCSPPWTRPWRSLSSSNTVMSIGRAWGQSLENNNWDNNNGTFSKEPFPRDKWTQRAIQFAHQQITVGKEEEEEEEVLYDYDNQHAHWNRHS